MTDHQSPASKQAIFDMIRSERHALEALVAPLSREQLLQPGVEGEWSIKDILAHIVVWEGRMRRWIDEALRGEVPHRPEPGMTWDDLDRLNDQDYRASQRQELEGVLADFQDSYRQAYASVEALSEADLLDPQRFAWREGEPLWKMVDGDMFGHYREHRASIERWLQQA